MRDEEKQGGRQAGRQAGRQGEMEEWRNGGRENEREGGREGRKKWREREGEGAIGRIRGMYAGIMLPYFCCLQFLSVLGPVGFRSSLDCGLFAAP